MSTEEEAPAYLATRLARELKVSPGTIRRWATEEGFPNPQVVHQQGYQLGRRWDLGEVKAWLEKKQHGSVAHFGGHG